MRFPFATNYIGLFGGLGKKGIMPIIKQPVVVEHKYVVEEQPCKSDKCRPKPPPPPPEEWPCQSDKCRSCRNECNGNDKCHNDCVSVDKCRWAAFFELLICFCLKTKLFLSIFILKKIFFFSWKFLFFKFKCFRLYFVFWSIFYEFVFFVRFFFHIRNNCYGNDKCVMECGKPIIIEPDRCRGCNQNCPGNQPPLIWRCEPGKSLFYVQIPKTILLSDFVSNPDLLKLYMDSNLEIDANGISGRVCLNDKTRLDLIRLNATLMSVDRKWDVMSCVQQEIKKNTYIYLFHYITLVLKIKSHL